MAATEPTLTSIAAQLDRMGHQIAGQQKQLTRMTRQIAELDHKLRHVIQRLPDEYDSARVPPARDDADDSDSYLDSPDD